MPVTTATKAMPCRVVVYEPPRHNRIKLVRFGWGMRRFFNAALVVLVACAAILVLFGEKGDVSIGEHSSPKAIAVLLIGLMPFALALLLTGALYSLMVLRVFLVVFLVIIDLLLLPTHTPLLLTFWGVTHLLLVALGWHAHQSYQGMKVDLAAEEATAEVLHMRPAFWWTFRGTAALLVIYYYGIALIDHSMGAEIQGLQSFTSVLIVLSLGLIPMYILAGTDYAELSEAAATGLLRQLIPRKDTTSSRTRTTWLMVGIILINGSLIAYDIFFLRDPKLLALGGAIFPVGLFVVTGGLVFVTVSAPLVRFIILAGNFKERPHLRIRKGVQFLAMIPVMALVFVGLVYGSRLEVIKGLLVLIVGVVDLVLFSLYALVRTVTRPQDSPGQQAANDALTTFILALVSPIMKRISLTPAQRRMRRYDLWEQLTFAGLTLLTIVFAYSRVIGGAGPEVLISPVLIVLALNLLLRQHKSMREDQASAYFILSVSLWLLTFFFDILLPHSFVSDIVLGLLSFIFGLFHAATPLPHNAVIPSFLIIIGALFWDLFWAEELAKPEDADRQPDDPQQRAAAAFPRSARCYLHLGYILVALIVLLLLADFDTSKANNEVVTFLDGLYGTHGTTPNVISALLSHPFDHTPWILIGIMTLGTATLLTHFIQDLGLWRKCYRDYLDQEANQHFPGRGGVLQRLRLKLQ